MFRQRDIQLGREWATCAWMASESLNSAYVKAHMQTLSGRGHSQGKRRVTYSLTHTHTHTHTHTLTHSHTHTHTLTHSLSHTHTHTHSLTHTHIHTRTHTHTHTRSPLLGGGDAGRCPSVGEQLHTGRRVVEQVRVAQEGAHHRRRHRFSVLKNPEKESFTCVCNRHLHLTVGLLPPRPNCQRRDFVPQVFCTFSVSVCGGHVCCFAVAGCNILLDQTPLNTGSPIHKSLQNFRCTSFCSRIYAGCAKALCNFQPAERSV